MIEVERALYDYVTGEIDEVSFSVRIRSLVSRREAAAAEDMRRSIIDRIDVFVMNGDHRRHEGTTSLAIKTAEYLMQAIRELPRTGSSSPPSQRKGVRG